MTDYPVGRGSRGLAGSGDPAYRLKRVVPLELFLKVVVGEAVIFGGLMERVLEGAAQSLIAGKAGAADHIFDGGIGFAQQEGGAGDATALNFIEQGGAGDGLESALQGAPVYGGVSGDVGHADLIVALAPDVIHGSIHDGIAGAGGVGLVGGGSIHQEVGKEADGLPGKLERVAGAGGVHGVHQVPELLFK